MRATASTDFILFLSYVGVAVWYVHVKNAVQVVKSIDQWWDRL